MAITSFSGDNRFLSNYTYCKVMLDGIQYPTTEHAYQAAKTTDLVLRGEVNNCSSPNDAKKLGQKIVLRDNWETIKFEVMEDLLRQKFNQPYFAEKLLNTGEEELVEGNWWGDVVWGVCNGRGRNMLGILLMKIRKELQDNGYKND